MLQFSPLGSVSDDFVDCLAEGGDADVCRQLHPATPDAPTTSPIMTAEEQQIASSHACDVCDPNTQWCDGTQCIPFTVEEQAQWAAAGKPPGQIVVKASPVKASLIPGVSNTMLAVGAALLGLGVIAYKRTR